MKLITEEMVRNVQEGGRFLLERGAILSPGAQALLRSRRVSVDRPVRELKLAATAVPPGPGDGYTLAATGERVAEKGESLTQLIGDRLVPKDHPRIRFRGELDQLQAEIVLAQTELAERGVDGPWLDDLEDILALLRQVLRSEVLDLPLERETILGLTPAQLREQSHDPKRFFGVEAMTLPHHSMGPLYARLNYLRARSRMVEQAAVTAFREAPTGPQRQILQTLNRLSSAFHILMCRCLAAEQGGR